MVTTPSEVVLAADADIDDVIINVDDVPVIEPIRIPFIYGGQRYVARTPKDSVFLELVTSLQDTSTNNLDDGAIRLMLGQVWQFFAAILDQDTFEDIANRYRDPDDGEATAQRLIMLFEALTKRVMQEMETQMAGLVDQKKPRKKPQDRKPKQK